MQRSHRLNQIVSAVVARGRIDVPTLASEFGVSYATIRRDLDALQDQRLVRRTHGGATIHAAFHDLPLSYKTARELPQKRSIARRALEFLRDARVIGTTGGTTVTQFANLLHDRDGLTVVTNALNIAADLIGNPRLRVVIAGGEVRGSSQESVGRGAEAFLSGYPVDVAFVGVDGVDATAGCTTYDPAGARVNAALVRRARTKIVLADATKIGRVTLAPVCPMREVDVLITDSRAPAGEIARIRALGCRVIRVPAASQQAGPCETGDGAEEHGT
ncbi:MAG TPA: DeoR/GlpR family DNA-binding transcription regulator [Trebonia sp.]|jgi:DeoR family transcriptional regulator of aga operon|nr:DeoR/GlpR family DNA-binding transcription regulator [Trebonia sp.]